MKYIALIGTAAQQSYNRELLQFMKHHFSQRATIDVNEITGIPLFNEPTQNHIPATVQALNDKISQADGVIIGVPEYDHAIPAALKNVIEWLSYQLHPFANKPVMLVGTSLGVQGTCRAQGDLRNILNAPGVDAQVLPGNEYMLSYAAKAFDQNGQMTDAPSIKFLERCFDNFEKYVKALNGTPALNVNWHGNYDVIVLGFGGAGASAARFAADNGAHVLVVDAAPFGREGGNTRYSAQHVVTGESLDKLTAYYQALGAPFSTPTKTLNAYLSGMSKIPAYFEKYLGIKAVSWKHDIKPGDAVAIKKTMAEYPELAGSDTIDFALVHKRDKDAALWKLLRQKVLERADNIDVWLDSRAQHLIQDPNTKVIQGVQIKRGERLLNIHANNGVVLAMGGFENNPELKQTYLHSDNLTPLGTLYNRGDGIKMAQEVDAKMWHMTNYESHGILPGITFKEDANERGRQIEHWPLLKNGSIFVIADDGTRYFQEDAKHRHGHVYTHGSWLIPMNNQHPYLIFDQTQYDAFKQEESQAGQLPYPKFMTKLVSAPTIAQLAAKLGVPANNLQQTVTDFNHYTEVGRDFEFDRDPQTMPQLDDGPYYAIATTNDVLNTQGGPQRNENAQILNVNDEPIPHLFGAGELGGIVANCYQGGGNLAECLIFGKLAGENAARPKVDSESVTANEANGINDLVDGETASNVKLAADQYLGSSNAGLGGKVIVRVTYNDHKIQAVDVIQHHESEDVGLTAIDQIPQEIVAANSTSVDAVSGASASSRAIKEAVQNALKQVKDSVTN